MYKKLTLILTASLIYVLSQLSFGLITKFDLLFQTTSLFQKHNFLYFLLLLIATNNYT